MNSPNDFSELERRVTRALRSHGDSVEPSADAYARLARAVNKEPRPERIRGILSPKWDRDRLVAPSGYSLRPLAFVAIVIAVAGIGGYSLLGRVTSATDTVTAAPATADPSDLLDRSDDDAAAAADSSDADPAEIVNDGGLESTSDATPLADSAEGTSSSSVPSDSTSAGSATTTASDPVELFAGLTYSPVRVTGLEAAEAFLDLLSISDDDLVMDDRGDRIIVRIDSATAGADQSKVLTTLSIEPMGDGFMVVDARSDAIDLAIQNADGSDPTPDQIADQTVVADVPLEVEGNATEVGDLTVSLVSTVDGSAVDGVEALEPVVESDGGFGVSVPVVGSHRVWVVGRLTDADSGLQSLTAQSALVVGSTDPRSYTVVGLSPDDSDGGLVIRAAPNGSRVGVIPLSSTDIRRRPIPSRTVDGLTWWAVVDNTGQEGWVASQYLAVDESPTEAELVELARDVVAAATDGGRSPNRGIELGRPVFVGSIVDARPVSGTPDLRALLTTKRRLPDARDGRASAIDDGTVAEFYGFDRWSEAEVFVPRGYREEGAEVAARAFFGDLPSVVVRSLNPESGGWERVHLFVTEDGDRPSIIGMVLEREPLPGTGDGEGSTAKPPPDSDD